MASCVFDTERKSLADLQFFAIETMFDNILMNSQVLIQILVFQVKNSRYYNMCTVSTTKRYLMALVQLTKQHELISSLLISDTDRNDTRYTRYTLL